jgi:DNA-binding transcriptional MerR regulator
MGMNQRERRTRREYFSIGEVCGMLDLKPHVLRYWETQFEELTPPKNRAGNRVYRAPEVELIALIQRLVHEEKYTLEGARRRLQELRDAGSAERDAASALERSYLRSLRSELESVLELLSPALR